MKQKTMQKNGKKRDLLRKFRRYDEYGFINPDYDKVNVAIGTTVMVVMVIVFFVVLVAAIVEANTSEYRYYPYSPF